ncbi:DNA repair protein RecO [Pseudoroseicyclus tamaricis]|uniref:DNA repair protein RecO n=1 Tax=Pseudoroseicyclus tamaricis TaxID=2705421 RepID=A0A6B2JLB2_9RHOB|nr:DNA repair protein RecO [Pseudoroseicyclus tamaricis]NDV02333.1 DNA repair protein RecO [Pseudoroseicyclus tamaricis]
MEWRDEGFVLSARPHGETAALIEVMSAAHGRHAGLVRGGISRKARPHLQPGNLLDLTWRARLPEHLGSFTFEPRGSSPALSSRLALAGVSATCALLSLTLPERDPHPGLFQQSLALIAMAGDPLFPLAYLQWERALLDDMGFGLDLSSCAVTGATEGLAYVSPTSGRAVSAAGAGEWAPRLLELPPILLGLGNGGPDEIARALGTTGWFIEHRLLASTDHALPPARARLVDAIRASA